jgi:hypothetical protein
MTTKSKTTRRPAGRIVPTSPESGPYLFTATLKMRWVSEETFQQAMAALDALSASFKPGRRLRGTYSLDKRPIARAKPEGAA